MLCEKCYEREANCHVCSIINGVMTTSELCIECHEASSPETRELRNARCEYCCGQANSGGSDIFASMAGVERRKYMCNLCSPEYHRYIQLRLERIDFKLPQQEQIPLLLTLNEEVREHMIQWVAERDSG
jgi:hypothetical protein